MLRSRASDTWQFASKEHNPCEAKGLPAFEERKPNHEREQDICSSSMNRLGKSYPRASKFGPWFSPLDAPWLDVALFKLSLRLCLRFAKNGSHLQGFEGKNILHLLHTIITSAPHYQVDSWELKPTTLEWFQSLFLSSDHLIYQTILYIVGNPSIVVVIYYSFVHSLICLSSCKIMRIAICMWNWNAIETP